MDGKAANPWRVLPGLPADWIFTDRETLVKAKQDPEKYASLVVRVGGFSDYFCLLNPNLQEEIIARTEF